MSLDLEVYNISLPLQLLLLLLLTLRLRYRLKKTALSRVQCWTLQRDF